MSELRTNRIVPRDGLASGVSGGIIQVVSATKTTSQSINSLSGNNWSDVSNCSPVITPTRSDSKILIMYNLGGGLADMNGHNFWYRIHRSISVDHQELLLYQQIHLTVYIQLVVLTSIELMLMQIQCF